YEVVLSLLVVIRYQRSTPGTEIRDSEPGILDLMAVGRAPTHSFTAELNSLFDSRMQWTPLSTLPQRKSRLVVSSESRYELLGEPDSKSLGLRFWGRCELGVR
ncbi:hypothetical protein BHE74_00000828, partial [Ensete ventricosum]